MPKKTKATRINLRQGTKAQGEKEYMQALVTLDDHKKLPSLAERIKLAHPGREIGKVADVLHFCIEVADAALPA